MNESPVAPIANFDIQLQRLGYHIREIGIRRTARKVGTNPMAISRLAAKLINRRNWAPVNLDELAAVAFVLGWTLSLEGPETISLRERHRTL